MMNHHILIIHSLAGGHDPATRDTMPADRKPKVIHWVNAKETCLGRAGAWYLLGICHKQHWICLVNMKKKQTKLFLDVNPATMASCFVVSGCFRLVNMD